MATAKKTRNNGSSRQPRRGPKNPYVAAATAPDTGGIVARSTLPKPIVLVLDEEQAITLHRLSLRAGDETLATLVKRKIDWTATTNAKLASQRTSASRPNRRQGK